MVALSTRALPYLRSTSLLYYWLTRDTTGKTASVYKDIAEMNYQLNCILILASVFVNLRQEPGQVLEYRQEVENKIWVADLDAATGHGMVNIAFIMQDTECCFRSDSIRRMQWDVAGFLWVCKFMGAEGKAKLKSWLLGFLKGASVEPRLQFSHFDFSYVG